MEAFLVALTSSQDKVATATSEVELLQATLNGIGSGVASVADDGRVITSNDRFYDMLRRAGLLSLEFFGRSREEIVTRSLYDVAPRLQQRPRQVTGLTGCKFELQYIDARDQLGGTLILMQDVTSQHRSEQAMQEVLEQKQVIEQARTTFVSQVAHHFRTPLNVILGYIDILSAGDVNEVDAATRNSYLGFIRESASALLLNMNEMMEIIRLQRNQQPVELEARALHTLLSGAIEEIQPVLISEEVELDSGTVFETIGTRCARMDARLARRAMTSLLCTSAVLGGTGSCLRLRAQALASNFLCIKVEFDAGRTDVQSILDSIDSGEPVKEISLTGNASGYGLALAAILLRLCQIEISATAIGERGVCIEMKFSGSDCS